MSRLGRRRPWMVGGAIGLAICLFVIAIANNVPTLIVAWFVAQLAANACFAAYLATIADQIPESQSATITALGGVMQNVGILAAIYLASALTSNVVLPNGYGGQGRDDAGHECQCGIRRDPQR